MSFAGRDSAALLLAASSTVAGSIVLAMLVAVIPDTQLCGRHCAHGIGYAIAGSYFAVLSMSVAGILSKGGWVGELEVGTRA